jgi:hypothetical protein
MHRLLPLVLGALIAVFVLPTGVAAKPPAHHPYTQPVTGTLQDGTGSVTGTLTIDRFARQDSGVVAIGTFAGTITDAAGVPTTGTQAVTLPVVLPNETLTAASQATTQAAALASCPILHLELGPLDLDLLGLKVHLDKVVLDITADQGPGNLLGNLLCAIAGLLDPGPNPIGAIVGLLNQILAILQGL